MTANNLFSVVCRCQLHSHPLLLIYVVPFSADLPLMELKALVTNSLTQSLSSFLTCDICCGKEKWSTATDHI